MVMWVQATQFVPLNTPQKLRMLFATHRHRSPTTENCNQLLYVDPWLLATALRSQTGIKIQLYYPDYQPQRIYSFYAVKKNYNRTKKRTIIECFCTNKDKLAKP